MLEIINKHHENTDGHCGLSVVKLSAISGLEIGEVKKKLNQLWEEKKIKVRDGINGKLIFKKVK